MYLAPPCIEPTEFYLGACTSANISRSDHCALEFDLFIFRLLWITSLARWYGEETRDGPQPRIATRSSGELGSVECWYTSFPRAPLLL